jgi:hypothetical protein
MMGLQCPKRLWLHKNRPELKDEQSEEQQRVFERGTHVGMLARELFPNGRDASPPDTFSYSVSVRQTYDWVQSGEKVIYEAAFQYDRVLAAIDILVMERGKWKAYEVKSSTEVKEQFIQDAALQYYVLKNAGIDLQDICIVHLNNEYVRQGPLDLEKLFVKPSVLKEVLALQGQVEEQVRINKKTLVMRSEPDMDIGPHCNDPYVCEFLGYCWQHIPSPSVFELTRMRLEKKFSLYREGIVALEKVFESVELTERQTLQVRGHLEGYTHIEPDNIRDWLSQLQYPVYFMDFETFNPAVPLYDNSRPYQQIPFQFSVHRLDKSGGTLTHEAFLGEPEADPRPAFIERLLKALGKKGTILAYNLPFESTRLRELQSDFPNYADDIEKLFPRMADLMEPFQRGWYHTPDMNGSYSIKQVLPALVPGVGYEGMDIAGGGEAMAAFEGMLHIRDPAKREKIRNGLLAYCEMDTLAMVKILEKLSEI